MEDLNLRRLLQQRAYIARLIVRAGPALQPLSPEYEKETEATPALVQPWEGGVRDTVAGAIAEATHVVYLPYGTAIGPGDRLYVENDQGTQVLEALAVEDEAGQGHHWRVIAKERMMSEE